MEIISTQAILLNRISFGDYDYIVTMFTIDKGKIPILVKFAKKSVKRFAGILEPFSLLNIVFNLGTKMPILQEATICDPFLYIREDIGKTAYASYWNELVYICMMEREKNLELYQLLLYMLSELNKGIMPLELYSVMFQMRFMSIVGLMPNLHSCSICDTSLDSLNPYGIFISSSIGGICCSACVDSTNKKKISKGTLKQLLWINSIDLSKALRVHFTPSSLSESLAFLESFVPYHIGQFPKSLDVIEKLRQLI